MAKPTIDLSDLASTGATITIRATPNAARDRITRDGDDIRVYTTAPPENGKANAAIQKLLAKALGCAPTNLTLIRGQTGRSKSFRIDG
jgi:uncharacterized protein (TIGR00251 family)